MPTTGDPTSGVNEFAAARMADQEFLRAAAQMDQARCDRYALYRDYYAGEQRTRLTDRLKEFLQRSGVPWSENFCETIVDALTDRLTVEAFTCEPLDATSDPDDTLDTAGTVLSGWITRCGLEVKQGVVHHNTALLGECCVIVDWDATRGLPRFSYNHPDRVKFVYSVDDPDVLEYVVKTWNSSYVPPSSVEQKKIAIRRMNLYYPDRVEKWFTTTTDGTEGANWQPWVDGDDQGAWPVWFTRTSAQGGEPRGIPAFHFRNKAKGDTQGRSEIHGTIPQQDGVNKTILDLFMVLDEEGLPQDWATGVGKDSDLERTPGVAWTTENPDAKFGRFDPGDTSGILEAVNAALSRIAARSGTPIHLLNPTGVLPSGETLKVAEAPLAKKAQDRQVEYGATWSEAMVMAVRLHNDLSGNPSLPEDMIVRPIWGDAQSRNEFAEAQTAEIWHGIGASAATLLRNAGFDPEVESEQRDEENQRAMDQQILDPRNTPPPTGGDEDPESGTMPRSGTAT